jgi:uncharacterized protein with PQ loop repeat
MTEISPDIQQSTINRIGTIAMCFTFLQSGYGFGSQLIVLLHERSTKGLSSAQILTSCLGFGAWSFYGWLSGNWRIAAPNGLGFLLSAACVVVIIAISFGWI